MNDQLARSIHSNVSAALQEDLGSGDKTAQLVPESTTANAVIICREPMTLAGQPWVDEVFRQIDPDVDIQWLATDGDHLPADAEICELRGAARSLLSGERTALNFVRLGSGMSAYLTLFAALVYGVLDESHQSGVAGRSSEVADVVADVFGAALAVVFWFGLTRLWRTRSGKRSGN